MLRKHDGPRQFVYYSKSVGQGTAARKYLQQEQWQLTGPGPSKTSLLAVAAPQSRTNTTVLPCHGTPSSFQPRMPASQPHQHFAEPPPAPPCPPVPWLSGMTAQQGVQAESKTQTRCNLQLRQQDHAVCGVIRSLPPLPPPLPPGPWAATTGRVDTEEQQAGQQQQQHVHKQEHPQLAAPPPAPPLPPLPFAAVARTSSAADTPAQQPSQPGRSAHFAPPPVPPPLPPQYRQSQGSNRAKLSNGRLHAPVPQQQQQPQVSNSIDAKAATSDVHRLVAQQAAAAALKRRERSDQLGLRERQPQAAAAASMVSQNGGDADHLVSTWCLCLLCHMHSVTLLFHWDSRVLSMQEPGSVMTESML